MRALLFKLVRWLNKRISTSIEVDGLWIGSWEKDDGSVGKIRTALDLIRAHDPRRYRRLLTDLRGIWGIRLPGSIGQFISYDWFCEVDLRFVATATSEDLASVIVHEATHARLWRRGHRYEEALRPRVEAICFRQQRIFAERLPNPSALAGDANDPDLSPEHLSDKSLEARHRRGSVALLRDMNMPRWVIGFMLRRERRRRRRHRKARCVRAIADASHF